jgi:hypothetical protein
MCSRGKAIGGGSSAPRDRCAAQEEKRSDRQLALMNFSIEAGILLRGKEETRSQSGEDSDESTKKTKKKKDLTKYPSAADAAREEMASHLNENVVPKTLPNNSVHTASKDR